MQNNQTTTTANFTEATAACWPVPESATKAVKEFIGKYYPGGLVYLHNGFLAYSGGYWVDLCCRWRKYVEIWRRKTVAEFGVEGLTNKGPGGPLVFDTT